MSSLMERVRERIADPLLAVDAAKWVRPMPHPWPPATADEVRQAEQKLGFSIPPLLRNLYTQVANGGFGPANGLDGVPAASAMGAGSDLVTPYLSFSQSDPQEPVWQWPRGLVPLVDRGCNIFDCVSFIAPPYPVVRFDPDNADTDRPIAETLLPIANSLQDYLEAWLASEPT